MGLQTNGVEKTKKGGDLVQVGEMHFVHGNNSPPPCTCERCQMTLIQSLLLSRVYYHLNTCLLTEDIFDIQLLQYLLPT
jgi:hypothetical protein